MKKVKWFAVLVCACILSASTLGVAAAAELTLGSPQLKAGTPMAMEQVFNGFGCSGKNVSPELTWTNVPAGTRSLALTMYDPDAPTGSGWWHWLIFNIDPKVTRLVANAGDPKSQLAPQGSVQSKTDFGLPGYGGPCPPAGDKPHRYIFTLFALKVDKLPLDESASGAMVGFNLNQNALQKAQLTVLYSR
jgi:Raf kinase inhibitor-like YbhB/YbcL family protein